MSASELLSRLFDGVPAVAPVLPAIFIEDRLLPTSLAPVEPAASRARVRRCSLGSTLAVQLKRTGGRAHARRPGPGRRPGSARARAPTDAARLAASTIEGGS